MLKKILCIAIILLLAFSAVACTEEEPTATGIRIKSGSVKQLFDVDEEFCFGEGKIEIVFSDGSLKTVEITADALSNFFTYTTGERTATVKYEKFSTEFNYEVKNVAHPSRDIVTTARLAIDQIPYLTGISRAVEIKKGDLGVVKAVEFTIKGNSRLCDTLSTVEIACGYRVEKRLVSDTTLKIIVYGKDGIAEGEFLKISFAGVTTAETEIVDVTVSDGETDYYLPDVKGV